MTPDRNHIPNEALEALAAGDAGDETALAHLDVCERCRTALAGMRAENECFAVEFALLAKQEDLMNSASASVRARAVGGYKPFYIYAIAASVMLVAALGIIFLRKAQSAPKPGNTTSPEMAAAKTAAPEKTQGDQDKKSEPAPVTPPPAPALPSVTVAPAKDADQPGADDAVYEGMTARMWISSLYDSTQPLDAQKATHALIEIGRDGLPQMLQSLRDVNLAAGPLTQVLDEIHIEPADLTQFNALLKDPKFGVRQAAIELLKNLAIKQPTLADGILESLKTALEDRDKAVVESTRAAILEVEIERLLNDGKLDLAKEKLDDLPPLLRGSRNFERYQDRIDAAEREQAALLGKEEKTKEEVKLLLEDLSRRNAALGAVLGKAPAGSAAIDERQALEREIQATRDQIKSLMPSQPLPTTPVAPTPMMGGSVSAIIIGDELRAARTDAVGSDEQNEKEAEKILVDAQQAVNPKVYPVAISLLSIKLLGNPRYAKTRAAAKAKELLDKCEAAQAHAQKVNEVESRLLRDIENYEKVSSFKKAIEIIEQDPDYKHLKDDLPNIKLKLEDLRKKSAPKKASVGEQSIDN